MGECISGGAMKHIFIINPVAGTGKARGFYMPRILDELKKQRLDYKLHITTKPGDAKRFVRRLISFRREEKQTLRFYACGGDGTLNEVLNGIGFSKNVQLACIPAGTGNDFVRNFGDAKSFCSIPAQLNGRVQAVDVMEVLADDKRRMLGINLVNMGLDCEATKNMEAVKNNPLLKGSAGYLYGAAKAFVQLIAFPYTIYADEKKEFEGEATLLAIGNGTTYGGGFRATPEARVDDGRMDMCLVRRINRRQFAKLIVPYRKGEHLQAAGAERIIHYRQVRSVRIEGKNGIEASIDGELLKADTLEINILHKKIQFVVPKGK